MGGIQNPYGRIRLPKDASRFVKDKGAVKKYRSQQKSFKFSKRSNGDRVHCSALRASAPAQILHALLRALIFRICLFDGCLVCAGSPDFLLAQTVTLRLGLLGLPSRKLSKLHATHFLKSYTILY